MSLEITPGQFKESVCSRLKELRLKAGYERMTDFAKALGIPATTYPKYENRSLLPHRYITRVCRLTGCDEHYFLTGQTHGQPLQTLHLLNKVAPYVELLDAETIDEIVSYLKIKQTQTGHDHRDVSEQV
ncbi:MAG: helix-turn-helix transcriptional regulator [Gammaproteobacteria bacterium]|nr:helix-turn-helix transcriptional regulator [Gammaproteobacteria bacterium]